MRRFLAGAGLLVGLAGCSPNESSTGTTLPASSLEQAMILRVLAQDKYEIYTQYEEQKWALQSCPEFVRNDQRLPACE